MGRPKKVVAEQPLVVEGAEPFIISGEKAVPVSKLGSITVTFTGDPRGGKDPEVSEYGGKSFPKGEPVTVDDPTWIRVNSNIKKNNHFKVE